MPAPIALFVYDRTDTVRQTIEHLLRNTLAPQTDLIVFSDGGKDTASWQRVNAVRSYLHSVAQREAGKGLKSVSFVERPTNFYLERNITEGVEQVLRQHGEIIVLEDDICTAPHFLQYMNDALETYRHTPRVMHITGFTNLDVPQKGDVYFTPHMAGWGWATWADRWLPNFRHYTTRAEATDGLTPDDLKRIEYGGAFHCLQSLDRTPIPWDICWEMAIYRQHGLCLSPTQTLVRNCGIGGGTHFSSKALFGHYSYDRPFITRRLVVRRWPVAPDTEIERVLYPRALADHGFVYNPLGKAVRALLRGVRKLRGN